tara:strand:- start:1 stop:3474 length:3474 start_codon:yes stop_codon:yes gene_type:complete
MATPNVVPRATTEGGIGTSAKSWGKLHIKSSASLGEATVTVTNQDADQILLDINANNTTADVIDIVSTTLTTGSLIKGTVTNSSATLNNVHGFANFNWTKSGNTGDGQSYIITGQSIELVDLGASNHANSTVNQKGLDILVDSFNTNGSNTNTGIEIDVTDATLNYGLDITAENGAGADIILRSSVDDGDIFSIATTTHGATTITTVDDDAAAAHLTFTIDGDFIVTSTDFSIDGTGTITDGVWEGDVIGVEYGGTGAGSYTDNAVLTGTGTSPITAEADLSFTSETLTIGADDNGAATIERKTHGDEAGGDLIVKAGNATGTDKAGGNLVLRAGAGTGTGDTTTGGSVDFVTAIPAGSGTGQQGILYPTAKFQSIANNNQFIIYEAGTAQTDFFRINVQAAGETTITTADSAGTDADLTFNIDGDMYIDPAGLDIIIGGDDSNIYKIIKKAHSDGGGGALLLEGGSATAGQTDDPGGHLFLNGGQSTGDAIPGNITFRAANPAGSTGTSLNSLNTIANLGVSPTSTAATKFQIYERGGASTADYLLIEVEEHGATTISTVDTAAAAADLTFTVDGKITMTPTDISGTVFHLDANADTDNVVDIDAGALDIDASAAITIDGVGIALGAGSGELDLTTTGTMDINSAALDIDTSGAIAIDAAGAASDIFISTAHTAGVAFHLDANANAASEVQIDAGILDVDVTGAATIDAVGIALGAGAGELDLTTTGTLDMNSNAFTLTATDSSSITVASSEDAEDLTIKHFGAHDSSVLITSVGGTGADAVGISTTVGSILLDSADNIKLDAEDNILLITNTADGLITLESAHTAGDAIHIHGDAAVDSVVKIDAGVLDINVLDNITIDAADLITIKTTDTGADGKISLISGVAGANTAIHIDGNANASSVVDIDAGILQISSLGSATIDTGGLFTVDSAQGITLDSATGDIKFADAGVDQLSIDMDGTAGCVIIKPLVTDDDLKINDVNGRPIARFNSGSVLGDDRPTVSGTSSSGTLTSNNAFGGFDHRKMVYNIEPGNDDNILNVEAAGSGSIYVITPTNGLTVHLPIPFGGEFYRFVILSKVNKTIAIRTHAIDGNDDIYMRCQTLADDGATTDIAGDTLTITNAGAGSYIDITNIKTGTNQIWQAEVFTTDDVAATVADS